MRLDRWPEDRPIVMAPAAEVDSLETEIGILLNLMNPNPGCHPFFISDYAALTDCSLLDDEAVKRRVEGYFGGPLPRQIRTELPEFIQALQQKFPEWPARDPSGVVLEPLPIQEGMRVEVEARSFEVLVLLNAVLPDGSRHPAGLTDATTVAGCSRLAPEVVQARLEAYFGIPLPIPLDLPVWRYCEAIQGMFPGWPDRDPSEEPSSGQQPEAEM